MKGQQTDRPFLRQLHVFRGFAIVNIVAIHAFGNAILFVRPESPPEFDRYLNFLVVAAFHDSTIYFALISGLLYARVLSGRGWGNFYYSKLKNVLVPYLLFSLLFTYWLRYEEQGVTAPFGEAFKGGPREYLAAVGSNLLTGDAMYQLWYMPVLALLFLATPLIAAALKSAKTHWVVVGLAFLPLFVSREHNLVTPSTTLYFLGAYTLGILAGSDYDRWHAWMERKLGLLLALAGIGFVALAGLTLMRVDRFGPLSVLESVHYVHKLAISGVALVLFERWDARLPKVLDSLATYSFAIFFLHAAVLYLLTSYANTVLASHPSLIGTLLLCAAWLVISIGVSMAIATVLRRILGRRSRMLVGA